MENSIERYKELRGFGVKFINNKLISFIRDNYSKEIVVSSANMLNMLQGKKTIAFDKEDDTQYLFDFALNEPKVDGKSAIQLYKEEVGAQNKMEEEFITALENSYTSIFRVINTSPTKGLIFLKDVLASKNVRLTDLGMSQMGNTDFLIFTRIIPFADINITSGMGCSFSSELELDLMQKYEQHIKMNPNNSNSQSRFLFFYNNFKEIGMNMKLQDVK